MRIARGERGKDDDNDLAGQEMVLALGGWVIKAGDITLCGLTWDFSGRDY